MKKLVLSAMLLGSILLAKAQNVITVSGEITSSTTWSANNQYLLDGWVYVTNGNTLTINPGTIIKGKSGTDAALIIERGAKIMAQGTAKDPIVFTSDVVPNPNANPAIEKASGDWGGVIICGKAPVNTIANGSIPAGEAQIEGGVRSFYGGNDPADNSGILSYVRIEYAGAEFKPGNEINALTLGGVGSQTKIDHVQTSYGFDDGIEFFGGTVDVKYAVAYGNNDDDFDMDRGFSGRLQYGVVIRNKDIADPVSGAHAFETDSYKSGSTVAGTSDNSKTTKAVVSNFTIVGPMATTSMTPTASLSPGANEYTDKYRAGVGYRSGSAVSIFNSAIAGFPTGIYFNNPSNSKGIGSTASNIQDGALEIKNVAIAGTGISTTPSKKDLVYLIDAPGDLPNTSTATEGADTTNTAITLPNSATAVKPFNPFDGPYSWFYANSNKTYPSASDLGLNDPFNFEMPNVLPKVTSPLVDGSFAASYTSSKLDNSFFTKETFVGAFGNTGKQSDNWMLDWVEFNPGAREYPMGDKTTSTTQVTTGIFNPTPVSNMIANVYPNPNTGSMKISYNTEKASNVNIAIYDLAGNKVSDVFNGFVSNGENIANFEGSSLVKGLYLIKISTDETVKTIKVTVN